MSLFAKSKPTAVKDWLRQKFPGPLPEISNPAFLAELGPDLYRLSNEIRLEGCLADAEKLDLSKTIGDVQASVDSVQAELDRVAGTETELHKLKARRDELSASGDFEPEEMAGLGAKIEVLEIKINRAAKLISAGDALRQSLTTLDKRLSTLRKWQSHEELNCGGIQFGGWQVNHPGNRSGTPPQIARKLLSLAEHGLKQARDLQAGRMPRLNRSVFGFSRRQIAIPFLSFVLPETDEP